MPRLGVSILSTVFNAEEGNSTQATHEVPADNDDTLPDSNGANNEDTQDHDNEAANDPETNIDASADDSTENDPETNETSENQEEVLLEEETEKPEVPPLQSPSDQDIKLKQILSPKTAGCATAPMTFQELRDNLTDGLDSPKLPLKCYLDFLKEAGSANTGANFSADLQEFDKALTLLGSAQIDPAERMSVTAADVQNDLIRIAEPLAKAHASADRVGQWLDEFGDAVNSLIPIAQAQAKSEVNEKLMDALVSSGGHSAQQQSLGSLGFVVDLGSGCRGRRVRLARRISRSKMNCFL